MRIFKTNFTLKNGKKGVALITVLLFMMMATIAATAVHKWLISENRASAARLKQNEAYQASQAGINAARAWLSHNGNETAALVTQFLHGTKTPISLDQLIPSLESSIQQLNSIKLVDVDTSSKPIAIKIISTGFGRDASQYSQVAILKVDGLYRIPIPAEAAPIDYNYAYFGGTTAFAGGHAATSMLINGNWSGNPGKVAQDFIVTGNSALSGDNITVGGYACIGGDFDAGNSSTVKHLYVAGNAGGKLKSITGNAYFGSNVDISNDSLTVFGNTYISGSMQTNLSGHGAKFTGNLCLGEDAFILFSEGGHIFKVEKNVWMPNEGSISGDGANIDNASRRILGNNSESEIYISKTYYDAKNEEYYRYHQEGNFWSSLWGMITGEYNWRYFATKAETHSATVIGEAPFECGKDVKEYCDTKWRKAEGDGCDGSNYKVDDMLTTAYSSFEAYANNSECSRDIHDLRDADFVGKLNRCYEQLNTPENKKDYLYNGFLVVKLRHSQLANPAGTLNGKFIFIYDEALGQQNFPPTTSNSVVMLYLNKGGTGEIMQEGSGTYNYFIYTKGDIFKIKGSNWNGSVYATAANCAKLKSMEKIGDGDSEFLQFDPEIIKILTSAKVICAAGHSCGNDSDSDDESGDGSANTTSDAHWIALAPTLKIDLASQYVNDEYINAETEDLNPSLLVMPRILYMNVGEQLVKDNDSAYNVLYLGGLQPTGFGSARCYQGSVYEMGTPVSETSPFPEKGLYSCRYTEGVYSSDFWVWVADVDESSKVAFREGNVSLAKKCKDFGQKEELVYLDLASGTKVMPGKLLIRILSSATGAHYTALSSTMFSLTSVDDDDKTWELTFPNTTPALTSIPDPLFKVEIDGGCGDAFGDINFYLIDEDPTDGLGIGHPNSESIELSPASGIVIHKPIEEYTGSDEKIKEFIGTPDCEEPANVNELTHWNPNSPLCEAVENDFNQYSGGWRCDLGTEILMEVANGDVDYREGCILVQDSVNKAHVASITETTYAYASLKKKPFILYIKIEGMMGNVNTYESGNNESDTKDRIQNKTNHLKDDEYLEDAEVVLLDENDKPMGTCKTGRKGDCTFTVYYGKTYYAMAKGEFFDHWSYNCESCKSPKTMGCECKVFEKKNYIAVTVVENDTIQANYTRKGTCFNENFEHLHSYCDEEVTAARIGGNTRLNAAVLNSTYEKWSNQNEKGNALQALSDAARGNGEYCIDQCVTTPEYRYSEFGGDYGTQYQYYYDIYCSVEGNPNIPIDMPVEYKERKENNYWSYYDPGVRCYQQINRRLEWSKIDGQFKYFYETKLTGGTLSGYTWCKNNNENNNTYRCIGKACESNSHPLSLYDGPYIRGGYYPQDDEWSPWLKVLNAHYGQHSKIGPRHVESKIGEDKVNGVIVPAPIPRTSGTVWPTIIWNVKPYIHREEGRNYLTPSTGSGKTSFVILRKQEAGYNGTYTEDFTWYGTGEANDGGSFSGIVFRSNADASSYFLLGINPSNSTSSDTSSHLLLCHSAERLAYYSDYKLSGSSDAQYQRELKNPYNTDHCVVETLKDEKNVNIPWNNIKQRALQVRVDLDDDSAHVTFAYANKNFDANATTNPSFDRSNMSVYLKKSFCLTCSEDFGYPIKVKDYVNPYDPMDRTEDLREWDYDPIARMDKKKNKYVGFVPHNQNKRLFNLNWRSGGSCGSEYQGKEAGVFCAFDDINVRVTKGEQTIPIRYVYDWCPDKGECTYEFSYSTDGGKNWIPEGAFTLPDTAKKYPKGSLLIQALARDEINGNREIFTDTCASFVTTTGNDKCYDNYLLFNSYNAGDSTKLVDVFIPLSQSVKGPDDWHRTKIGEFVTKFASQEWDGTPNNALDVRKELCKDEDGSDHYSAIRYCSEFASTGTNSHATTNTTFHPKDGTENKTTNLRTGSYVKLSSDKAAIDNEPEYITNYIQLKDTIGHDNEKMYLNLANSTFSFEMLQVSLADEIKVWMVDREGRKSADYIVPGVEASLNKAGNYCNVYDDVVSKEDYEANPSNYSGYYKELCQYNLVWVRDVKRLQRKTGYAGLYPHILVSFDVDTYAMLPGADENFNAQEVSKIYFQVKNSRGGGIYISQLKNTCASALLVDSCAIDGVTTSTGKTVNEGTMVQLSAKVAGTTECKIEKITGANKDLLGGTNGREPFDFDKYYIHNTYTSSDGDRFNINLVTDCEGTANCTSNFRITCKNTSGEEKFCNTKNSLTVKNVSAACYGDASNKTPVTYDGNGNLNLGAIFNNTNFPIDSYLTFTDDATKEKSIIEHYVVTDKATNACTVNSAGKTVNSAKCVYFQFKPSRSGTYAIAYGKDNQYVESSCKMDVEVPERALHSCAWNQNPLGGGVSVTASATGAYLSREGKLTLTKGGTTIEHGCTFNTDDGIVSCGFSAPMQNGSYSAEISFNDKTTPCENLVVASKPYPKDCKISDFGIFNAHIENLTKGMSYYYRLVVCKDMLGMGCTVDHSNYQTTMEGTDVSFSPTIKPSFENGKTYNYVFEVSASGDFEKDKESCVPEPEVKHQFEDNPNSAECRFATASIRKGEKTRIVVTNIKGITSDRVMEVRNANGDKAGTVIVNANGTPSADWDYRNKVEIGMTMKSGMQTYSVYDGEKLVCTADIDVLPITASSCKIVEVNNTNNEVTKGIAKTNVKFRADGISIGNITADFTAKAKRPGGGEKDVRLTPYNTTAVSENANQFGLPDLTGEVAYTLYDPSGDVICTTPAVEVAQSIKDNCGVANDVDATVSASTNICNYRYEQECKGNQDTHFGFYYKGPREPYLFYVVGAGDKHYCVEGDVTKDGCVPDKCCSAIEESCRIMDGYNCKKVIPKWNRKNVWNGRQWVQTDEGYIPKDYKYVMCADYSDYYGGSSNECCEATVTIGTCSTGYCSR